MTKEEKIILACAQAAHEVNRAYCIALGDTTQPPWENAPLWQRESALKGVESALAGATPEESHRSWFADKQAAGWKYGSVKDSEKKEHPCFVSYAALSREQRQKDMLFTATVRGVAAALGGKVTYPGTVTGPKQTVDWSKDVEAEAPSTRFEFTCPECGSHYWGSTHLSDGTLERMCHGFTGDGTPGNAFTACKFTWHERDDAKYSVRNELAGTTCTGQEVPR
jgi:hypothetical protein